MKEKKYRVKGILLNTEDSTDTRIVTCYVYARTKFTAKRHGRKILSNLYKRDLKHGYSLILNKTPQREILFESKHG